MTTTIIHRSKIGIEILVPVILVLGPAPALSIDRLEIKYKSGRVLVSPKDKEVYTGSTRTESGNNSVIDIV